jgi:hypothetical protein
MSNPSASTFYSGTLEIDHCRGVIYFHLDNERTAEECGAQTLLRICHLPAVPHLEPLDITHMVGCNWNAKGQP